MLKVKTDKGKFDIILNEDTLFEARPIDRSKGRTKGFSSKSPHVRTSHGIHVASKSQVTNVNHRQKNEKGKHEIKGQLTDDLTRKKTPFTRKELVTEGASYLTKDQLSTILSSIKSNNQEPPPGLRGSTKSEAQETSIHQSSTVDDEQRTDLAAHTPEVKTAGFIANPEQTSLTDKKSQWKIELDKQVALKQKLKEKENVLSKESGIEEYNPWGRPGGGAPVRTQSGNVVADYKKMVKNEVHGPSDQVTDYRPGIKTTGQASSAHDVSNVPAAMRSSFAVGAPGVVHYKADQSKAEEKKKWLQELEQQIKEKKEREAQEKLQQSLKEAKHDSWHQRTVPREPSVSGTVASGSAIPVTVEPSVAPASSVRAVNVHARGHGLQSLGQMNQDELERKRLKTLEHQLAIKEQVEEKRRLKQEEKERMMKEEAEKEMALAQERAMLQMQYEEELKLRREKEEEAKRRAEALQQSVLHAHESAQQEKAAKRIKQLESAGHDVSGLKSRMESRISPREHQAGLNSAHQDTGLRQSTSVHTGSSPHFTAKKAADSRPQKETDIQAISRIGQGEELPKENDRAMSSTRQKNQSFEAELKEISLNTSLESQWTPRSSPSNPRIDSRKKSLSYSSPSPRKDKAQKNKTMRSQSERSQRKKHKQLTQRPSLENVTQDVAMNPPPPLEDAFMLPYRRTSSATFHVALDTPLSHQDASDNRSKQLIKKTQSDQTAEYNNTGIKKDNVRAKVSALRGADHGASSKTPAVSRITEKRKVKQDKANINDRKSPLHRVQLSPDPLHTARQRVKYCELSPERLPTARQEMILKQLAALRQGLLMKERELEYGAL